MAAFAGVWINEAIRDKLEQDLRLWERFQLYQYLADINASLDCARSNKVSVASLPDRFSDSSAIFARWSWNSYRSWVPSRQQNGELIDMQTLTKRFGGASIDRFEVKAPGAQTGLHDSNIYHNCAEALSPLALAVRLERLDYVALALRENLSCHKSCCERYALCLGCLKGNSEVVASLLNAGIDPNLPGPPSLHVRPLTLAMLRDHRDVVKLLLEKGATVNDDSASYFLLAAKLDDVPLMHLMLKRGLSPDCTIESEPLIILSARKRYEGATTRLFEAGAYLSTSDCNGMTALHHASVNGHCGTVRALLRADASPEIRVAGFTQSHGLTPLMLACRNGHWQVVTHLLAKKANVHALDPLRRNAVHHACENDLPDSDAIVHHLLSAGADLNAPDVSGTSALMYAALAGNRRFVRDLLVCGADASVRAHSGLDAVRMARNCGHEAVVKILQSWPPGLVSSAAIRVY